VMSAVSWLASALASFRPNLFLGDVTIQDL
jgi:hypothetical protein